MKELRHLNKYFYKYKHLLVLGLFITVVARVFNLVTPKYVGNSLTTVEHYLRGEIQSFEEVKDDLLLNIFIIIGTALLGALFTFIMRQTIINMSRYVEFDLKNEIFKHYEILSLNFYKRNRTGDLMNRISEDVGKTRMYAGPAIMYGIQTITLIICVVPLMFYTAPKVALYTLVPLPILSFLIYKLSRLIHQKSTSVQQYLSLLTTHSQESFSGISVIKAYGIEPVIQDRFEDLSEESRKKHLDLVRVEAWFFPLMLLLIGLSNLFVIYIGGRQYIAGEIEFGVLGEFIMYVNMLTWPMASLGWISSIVQQAEASQKRINEFLKETPEIQNNETTHTPITGNITFDKVTFTYEDTKIRALKEVSFDIKKGQNLAVLGKTGSGKSTILELIGRLYDVEDGEIRIDGIPIKKLNLSSLREAIGVVPQDAFLFSDTIENNIRFGKHDATSQEVIAAAKAASVHENIIGFKDGYETVLGERGITLSGGQKQRVSIARALIKDAPILLLDDCLSAVDTDTEEMILNQLKKITVAKTNFIVSHRISSVKHADKIIVLDQGVLVQTGTHEELVERPGYYRDLYERQLLEHHSEI